MFKIATWNVNSLNVRLPHVISWLEKNQPDVLALQELKIPNEKFPHQELASLGYHCVWNGQKTYNGVALISKDNIIEPSYNLPTFEDEQKRVIAATTIQGLRIINLYIPNGESLDSPKFQYKIDWLDALKKYLIAELQRYEFVIVLGDFNIAPENKDVYDVDAWSGHILFSDIERQIFQEIINLGFLDSFRMFNQEEKCFSWWDYRMNGFKRNLGLRIDHILVSQALSTKCTHSFIDIEPRKAERPSDHTPVVLELNLNSLLSAIL